MVESDPSLIPPLAFQNNQFFSYRREQARKLNQLWQISFLELENRSKEKQMGSISERSLQSKHSNSTKMTLESMSETNNYAYFHFRQEPVAARKFLTKFTLDDNDHQQLRKVSGQMCARSELHARTHGFFFFLKERSGFYTKNL